MSKIDFKKTIKTYSSKAGVFEIVEVPAMQYLLVDGEGSPDAAEFAEALQALYPVAYKLKFASKLELKKDYVVPPLEAQWWADDPRFFTEKRDKSKWKWTAMLMTPDWITQDMFAKIVEVVRGKNNPKALDKVRLETVDEGLCVQTLHIGSFDNEGPVLEQLHDTFIPENNLQMTGHHHEIYLSDFRRVAPDKLRTILRQPVKKI